METELEHSLLQWISEESGTNLNVPVSIKLLMMRMALNSRVNDPALTESTQISLQAFERASLFRSLLQHERRNFIRFVDDRGGALPAELLARMRTPEASDTLLGYVTLTTNGAAEISRLIRLTSAPK